MSIAIADIRFTFHDYDPRGDTLFLSVGSPPAATWPEDTADTPEHHFVEYDEDGKVRAIELMNPYWLLKRDGELPITLPGYPTVQAPPELIVLLHQPAARA
jgi:uncharacterized protein YuzE